MRTKKLKILLISPKGQFLSKNDEFSNFLKNSREMSSVLHYWHGTGAGLQTIAGLTPEGHEITIVDENFEEIDFNLPADIVGLTAMTQQAKRAYAIAGEFKKRGRYVAMGGIHATVMPDEAEKHVDSVFIGEAENTWPAFIDDYCSNSQKRVYRQSDYGTVDMKKIPMPRYDLVSKYKYPVVWVQTTRGCPHDCEFCAATRIYGLKYKHKEIKQVIHEISELKKYWKFAQIIFSDDNMFVDRKFSLDLIHEFKKLNFNWLAQTDISIAEDEEFIKELRKSGCRHLFIGFESVSKKNLSGINKNSWKEKKFDKYVQYIDLIQRTGIGIYGAFIIGFDEDNDDTVEDTINFINDNNIMGAQITILTPHPGSRLRERLLNENRILIIDDWDYYTGWNSVIKHKNFTPEKLEKSLIKIYKSIYNYENFKARAVYYKQICENLI
jgi:radical SAM superfamily enzyme YgiQ (UPF0313 family)